MTAALGASFRPVPLHPPTGRGTVACWTDHRVVVDLLSYRPTRADPPATETAFRLTVRSPPDRTDPAPSDDELRSFAHDLLHQMRATHPVRVLITIDHR